MLRNGQLSDSIVGLAVSPAFEQDGLCFAAGMAGLYRSRDGGRSWQRVIPTAAAGAEAQAAVTSVIMAPSNRDTGDFGVVFAGMTGGVLRSLDGGDSWTSSPMLSPLPTVSALAVSPAFALDRTIFAGTQDDGVLCSRDGGSTWESWNLGLYDRHTLCLAVSPRYATNETLFAGTQIGIFQSSTGGRSWRALPFPPNAAPVLCLALAPDSVGETGLYAGTENAGVFASYDGGQTWSCTGSAGQGINALGVFPSRTGRPHIVAATDDRLVVLRDGAETFITAEGILCLAAPPGRPEAFPVLVGLAEGGTRWLTVEGKDEP